MNDSNKQRNFSFIELSLDGIRQDGNLIQILENLRPSSVALLNAIRRKELGLFSPENVPSFKFFSYEPDDDDDNCKKKVMNATERDWSDSIKPLFIVVFFNTKYSMMDQSNFTYRLLFSRDTLDTEDVQLLEKFSSLINLNTSKDKCVFASIDQRYFPFLQKVASVNNRKCTDGGFWLLQLSPKIKPTDLNPEEKLPPGFSLRFLNPEDAFIVSSNWETYPSKGMEVHCRDQILYSPTAGVVDDSTGELVSWAVTMPTGNINALFTKEGYRRKGLADVVMQSMCRQVLEAGMIPLTGVQEQRVASKGVMDKLGFELAYDGTWATIEAESEPGSQITG